jgi:hypothetical protein
VDAADHSLHAALPVCLIAGLQLKSNLSAAIERNTVVIDRSTVVKGRSECSLKTEVNEL